MAELTGFILKQNQEQKIVYAPVLVPNEPDSDGDVVTPTKIEQVAHKFLESYGNIDLQHTLNNVGRVIESFIAPSDLNYNDFVVPKGSWMMGVRVTDDNAWNAVKSGKLTGFSIMGIQSATMKAAKNQEEIEAATKRTTLADLNDDWVVNAVSLVDEPAVPKAKFLVIKSKEEPEKPKEKGFIANIISKFKGDQEGGEKMGDAAKIEGDAAKPVDEIQLLVNAFKTALKEHDEEKEAVKAEDGAEQTEEEKEELPTQHQPREEAEETITMSQTQYNELMDKVDQLAEASAKSKMISRRIIGQESTKNKTEVKPTRDYFGFRVPSE